MYQPQFLSYLFKCSLGLGIGLTTILATQVLAQPLAFHQLLAQTPDSITEELTLEQEVLGEINRVRTNPGLYADWLESTKQYYNGNTLQMPEAASIETLAGVSAVDEAIMALRAQSALSPLIASESLGIIAQRLLQSEGEAFQSNPNEKRASENSSFVNNLSYGTTAEIIVMQLVIDSVSRNKILQPAFEEVGVACQPVEQLENFCAVIYKGVIPKSEPAPSPGPVAIGRPMLEEQGSLADGDQVMASDNSLYDFYPIDAKQGQTITITLNSEDFDTFLALVDENNQIIGQNDDISDDNSNSALTVTIPKDGRYYVIVNSYDPNGRGNYTLTVKE